MYSRKSEMFDRENKENVDSINKINEKNIIHNKRYSLPSDFLKSSLKENIDSENLPKSNLKDETIEKKQKEIVETKSNLEKIEESPETEKKIDLLEKYKTNSQIKFIPNKKKDNGVKSRTLIILFIAVIILFIINNFIPNQDQNEISNVAYLDPSNRDGYKKFAIQLYERIKNEIHLHHRVSLNVVESDIKNRYGAKTAEKIWPWIIEMKNNENIIQEKVLSDNEKEWSFIES